MIVLTVICDGCGHGGGHHWGGDQQRKACAIHEDGATMVSVHALLPPGWRCTRHRDEPTRLFCPDCATGRLLGDWNQEEVSP